VNTKLKSLLSPLQAFSDSQIAVADASVAAAVGARPASGPEVSHPLLMLNAWQRVTPEVFAASAVGVGSRASVAPAAKVDMALQQATDIGTEVKYSRVVF
jgi:hypothetical protein